MQNLQIVQLNPLTLKANKHNSKKHPKRQIDAIADSIRRFGFNIPIAVRDGVILAGHGRVEAAKLLRLNLVPCVTLDHLTEEEARAYIIADNRTSELGEWDKDKLLSELQELQTDIDFDLLQLGALCGDLDLGHERPEFPADRADRLGEYIEPDDDFEDSDDDFEDSDDEPSAQQDVQEKKEPISFTFMVMLNRRQQKRLNELKGGLSDKEFFLQNVLGESE